MHKQSNEQPFMFITQSQKIQISNNQVEEIACVWLFWSMNAGNYTVLEKYIQAVSLINLTILCPVLHNHTKCLCFRIGMRQKYILNKYQFLWKLLSVKKR